MLGLMNHKRIKIARRNINNLRQVDDTTQMAESEKELKSLLMRVNEESEKAVLASSPLTSWQIEGETVTGFIFLASKIIADSEIKRYFLLGKKTKTNLNNILKSWDIILPTKFRIVKARVFLVVKYGCDLAHKKSWVLKNWCFQIVVLEKTLESPLDCKEIQPVNPKGNQPWIFIGRTDAEAPILWPSGMKNQVIGKDPVAGKDWWHKEKGAAEDEMVR